jgi:two-component system KDP operon response regulator KdpE
MQHAGDVCEYDSVITAVWGNMRDKDSLHELIYRVRRKIEPNPSQPRYLVIRSGIGVVLFPQGIKAE